MKEHTFEISFALICAALIVLAGSFLGTATCRSKWKNSGFEYHWTFIGGCLISRDKGETWIPEDNYREVP